MENLKMLIENAGFTVKIINQHKVEATKENTIEIASCLQTLCIKLGL